MSLIRQSLPALLREADRVLSHQRHAATVPLVVWARLDEQPGEFADRIRRLKSGRARILAAVPHGYPVPPTVQPVEFAPRLFELLHPTTPSRYRCASGGRGSGKSHAFATAVVLAMLERRLRVLAAREIMNSLRESVHHLLVAKIDDLHLGQFFEVTDRSITCTATGSEVIFAGLFANIASLKSLEAVGLCWIEEGEAVSARSLEILGPTIRSPGSEIWISMNPDDPHAPAMEFASGTRPDARHAHVTYADNPWFPAELDGERLYLQSVDADAYAHVWLGQCRTHSDAQILKGKCVAQQFEVGADWDGPYFGLDFGFSQDPTAAVRCYIHDRRLYIAAECYAVGVDIDATPKLLEQLGAEVEKHTMRADSARPETISYLQRHGFPNVVAVKKYAGSVEDGVAYLRQFEAIVIDPACEHALEEARLYSYRVDRLSGDVLPQVVDKHNHVWDAVRYALAPLICAPTNGLFELYKQRFEKLKRGELVNS